MKYKADDPWPQIRAAALKKASNRCEQCKVENHSLIASPSRELISLHDTHKAALIAWDAAPSKPLQKTVVIILRVALKNRLQLPLPENLICLCQRCHSAYTAPHRATLLRLRAYKFRDTADLSKQSRFGFAL